MLYTFIATLIESRTATFNMRKPYDHAEDEYPLCSQFADPTKTCGTRWDNKTIVFDQNEAWMTDGEHTAHLVYGPVEINPPLDEATTKEWTDAMTKAVNSMRTDDSTGVESYLHRHLDISARMPRRVTEGCYFEFRDQPTTNKPPASSTELALCSRTATRRSMVGSVCSTRACSHTSKSLGSIRRGLGQRQR